MRNGKVVVGQGGHGGLEWVFGAGDLRFAKGRVVGRSSLICGRPEIAKIRLRRCVGMIDLVPQISEGILAASQAIGRAKEVWIHSRTSSSFLIRGYEKKVSPGLPATSFEKQAS